MKLENQTFFIYFFVINLEYSLTRTYWHDNSSFNLYDLKTNITFREKVIIIWYLISISLKISKEIFIVYVNIENVFNMTNVFPNDFLRKDYNVKLGDKSIKKKPGLNKWDELGEVRKVARLIRKVKPFKIYYSTILDHSKKNLSFLITARSKNIGRIDFFKVSVTFFLW